MANSLWHVRECRRKLRREVLGASPCLHVGLELHDGRVVRDALLEINKLLAMRFLNFQTDIDASLQKHSNGLEICRVAISAGHSRGADPNATRGKSGLISRNRIAIDRDVRGLGDFLELGTSQTERSKIPQNEMVVSAACAQHITAFG